MRQRSKRMRGGICGPMCIPPLAKAGLGLAGAVGTATFISSNMSENSDISKKYMSFQGSKTKDNKESRVTLELCKRKGGCVTGNKSSKKGKMGKMGKKTKKTKKTKGPYVLRKNGKVIHSFQTFDEGRKKFRSLKERCINNGFTC